MSVQVIMKDGRPEWAVIPYAEYEALLARAGQAAKTEASSDPADSAVPAAKAGHHFSIPRYAALKAEKGKATAAIAKDAGISPAYCAQIEQGEREPSPAIIRGLAQALSVKPDDLLD